MTGLVEHLSYESVPTSDHKRRKVEGETLHVKAERGKAVATDKAKANYLSGQLRLRLQYARLKVEHGWQRQTLNEVENLYFRHTHLTRPYPVISPGGRRTGRTLSSSNLASTSQQPDSPVPTSIAQHDTEEPSSAFHTGAYLGTGQSRPSGTLSGSSSSSSFDTTARTSIPSTPNLEPSRLATPLAPHVGFGNTVTRYPLARSDSASTVVMESMPSLYHTKSLKATAPASVLPSPSQTGAMSHSSFHEPFDPMEPTEHMDSQLAALRSIITASSMPAVPSDSSIAIPQHSATSQANAAGGAGLTYDTFWSTHGLATSYRAHVPGQPTRNTPNTPLQAYANPPAVLGSSTVMNQDLRAHDDDSLDGAGSGIYRS